MKRNLLIYGAGASGKSTRLAEAAAFFFRTRKQRTRVVNADGGGTRSALQPLIELGAVEVWDIDLWDSSSIFATLDLATKGWWPSTTEIPNSELLPPIKEWFQCQSCGGEAGGKIVAGATCASCKAPLLKTPLLKRDPINGAQEVGLYCFEGLTAFGELMLRRLRQVDKSGGNAIKDGDTVVTNPGMQHYGMAQSYISQYVTNSRQLPFDVIWTALELKSDEDGKPLYGPALPGKKLTALCIPWFTDVLHLDALAKVDPKGQRLKDPNGQEILERKLYLMPHFPPDNPTQRFAAKTSAPVAGGMPTVIDADMGVFFNELANAVERAKKALTSTGVGT